MTTGKVFIGCILAVVIGLVIRFSLQFIPAFTIKEVRIAEETGRGVPASVIGVVKPLYGKNSYGFVLAELQKDILKDPVVKQVKVKRSLPAGLEVSLAVKEARAVLLAIKEDGSNDAYIVTTGWDFLPLGKADSDVYGQDVVRIEITPTYASMLKRYGVDGKFRSVLSMVGSLSDETSLITMVKYDNNSSNSLGKVVLVLAPLNAQISIREEVDALHLSQAIAVVKAEQAGQVPTKDPTRYDVYDSGLVRR